MDERPRDRMVSVEDTLQNIDGCFISCANRPSPCGMIDLRIAAAHVLPTLSPTGATSLTAAFRSTTIGG